VTDAWGIVDGYWDTHGEWHPTEATTAAALRQAMGAEGDGPPSPPPMWFVPQGDRHSLWNPCDVALEDGTVLPRLDELPPDLPLGYHELRPRDGSATTQLVVTPTRMPLPERPGLRLAGLVRNSPPARCWAWLRHDPTRSGLRDRRPGLGHSCPRLIGIAGYPALGRFFGHWFASSDREWRRQLILR